MLKSVTKNCEYNYVYILIIIYNKSTAVLKLFWLVALGLIAIYIYSVVTFAYFANEFHDPDSDSVQYCDSLFQCWVTLFHYILIGGVSCLLSFEICNYVHVYVYAAF